MIDDDATRQESPRGWLSLWPYALLLAVGLFVLLPRLGAYGFWDPWEPKYAEAAREMQERHALVVPYYRGDVRLTKPILVYWAILAGSAVFGLNEFGARIVGVLTAVATLLGVFYAVAQMRGRRAGLIAGLVLATVPQYYFIARQAMPDVYLCTSLGLCLLFLALGMLGPDRRRDVHFAISYACIALAVLAKGPMIIGAVLIGTLGIWLAIRIETPELWRPGRRLELSVFLGTTLPAAAVLAGLSLTAYLFGTSPAWWGYSGDGREDMSLLHNRIEDTFTRSHLSEIILVLVALGGAEVVWLLAKQGRRRTAIVPALVVLAALGGVFFGGTFKILIASLLGMLTCVAAIVYACRRFLHQDWLWPIVERPLKQIGRQLLLFAVVFFVIAGPWHIAIFYQQKNGYITDFIIKHNLHRASETVNRTGESQFYVRTLIFGLFPWSCFLPVAVAMLVGWWRRSALKRYGFEIFLMIAAFATFAMFTASVTKFSHYISPIIVPLCVLIGLAVDRTLQKPHDPAARLSWVVAAVLFVLPALDITIEQGSWLLVATYTMKSFVPENMQPGEYYMGLLVLAGVCLFASIVVRSRILVGGLVLSAVLMGHYLNGQFIPTLTAHKTMKHLCETWKANAPDGNPPICFFGDMKHGIYYYTESRIEVEDSRDEFLDFMDPQWQAYCIIERDSLSSLEQSFRVRNPGHKLEVVDKSHFQYLLVRNYTP